MGLVIFIVQVLDLGLETVDLVGGRLERLLLLFPLFPEVVHLSVSPV
jgi:hypothetical protein